MLIGSTVLAGVAIIYWQLSAGLEERIKLRVMENRDALVAIDSSNGFTEVAEVVKREAASYRAAEPSCRWWIVREASSPATSPAFQHSASGVSSRNPIWSA